MDHGESSPCARAGREDAALGFNEAAADQPRKPSKLSASGDDIELLQ
jgi:hypothetical protein